MSMEIRGNYEQYKAGYAKEVMSGQAQGKDVQERKEESPEKIPMPQDEYVSSEKSAAKPTGLYRLEQDEKGHPRVLYDDPRKADGADAKGEQERSSGTPGKPAEKCTANTDKVEREIRKLKEKKQQLEQQLQSASGTGGTLGKPSAPFGGQAEKKVRELEKKLAQVESELSRKDNDTYRRQNAEVSYHK